jgi:hypothetical protein
VLQLGDLQADGFRFLGVRLDEVANSGLRLLKVPEVKLQVRDGDEPGRGGAVAADCQVSFQQPLVGGLIELVVAVPGRRWHEATGSSADARRPLGLAE